MGQNGEKERGISRRGLLGAAAASVGGAVLARLPNDAEAQTGRAAAATTAAAATPAGAFDLASVPADPTRERHE